MDPYLYNGVKNGLVDLLGDRKYFASRVLTPYCYTLGSVSRRPQKTLNTNACGRICSCTVIKPAHSSPMVSDTINMLICTVRIIAVVLAVHSSTLDSYEIE